MDVLLTQMNIKIFSNKGHQDCLMSRDCREPFEAISQHLTSNNFASSPRRTPAKNSHLAHPVFLERSEPDSDNRCVFISRHDPSFNQLRRLALVPMTANDQLPSSTDKVVLVDVGENGCFTLPDKDILFPVLALLLVSSSGTRSEDLQSIQHWLELPSSHYSSDFKILR